MFSQRMILLAAVLTMDCFSAIRPSISAEPKTVTDTEVKQSVDRSLALLERSSAVSADLRTCFNCHGQAMPVLAFVEGAKRGFQIDPKNLTRQVAHTYAHLQRGRPSYEEGKGQGGGVDTAGYALWALEDGGRQADPITDTVIEWLFNKQSDEGFWDHSSNRPPSEASSFTTTYLALRALTAFADTNDSDRVEAAKTRAAQWLSRQSPQDTEDMVFRLLSTLYVDVPHELTSAMIRSLKELQQEDGGWAQNDSMTSDAYATGTVLYALNQTGTEITDPDWQRGLRFLLSTQKPDGSWHVVSRSKPFQVYFESGFPHGKDQFISTSATCWATISLLLALPEREVPEVETLAQTQPLLLPESDLSSRIMFGAHRFIDNEIERANQQRRKVSFAEVAQIETHRTKLREILGVVEARLPPRLERFGDDINPARVVHTEAFDIFQVRWPVFGNVFGEGLYVEQNGETTGFCVVVPDADQSPEQLLGLVAGVPEDQQIARKLVLQRLNLLIPTTISRAKLVTENESRRRADMTQREWIYRQAFHMGRHVIGYDLQRVLGAVDWFASRKQKGQKLGIVGYGEGGLVAMHAAAIDARIDATLISGYFDSSDTSWSEPIYRNVWQRSQAHGNAEIASLILPRVLIIEHSNFPEITDHKGRLKTPELSGVKTEFSHIRKTPDSTPPQLVVGENESTVGPWSSDAVNSFVKQLTHSDAKPLEPTSLENQSGDPTERIQQRQTRCLAQAEEHVQSLVHQSENVRDQAFLFKVMPEFAQRGWSTERSHPLSDPHQFIAASKDYRTRFQTDAMGKFDQELLPPNARTRKILETEKWTAYDVVLDVHEHLLAWGVLLVPKDLQPEERRPVVVCQHGRNGIPRDTIDANKPAYNNFAAELANRGFITFAPHNLYRGEDEYRWLDRKANALGCTLFSFIIASHEQTLRWLDTLPFVDGNRIAFYGLSYGGETAVRVPTVLEKYCLSICSGDFNQWTRKVASTTEPFSFMNTIEWEMPYWNLGHTFDYAEMAYLMLPRPFMVERGHNDGVGRDQWVAHEFAKVRWLYAQFGLADRVEIEFFQGGHSINGQGTFDFLHDHLKFPVRGKLNATPIAE